VGALQKPDATHVAGYRTWTALGRFVRRGEKGIFILAPMVGNKRNKEESAEQNTDAKETQRTLYGFRGVYVFDRLSRDLWPSLCAPDGFRLCHFGSPSIAASNHRPTLLPCATRAQMPGSRYPRLLSMNPGSARERQITTVNFQLARDPNRVQRS